MADNAVALTWIQSLVARGISIEARGARITVTPKSAYSAVMTEDERRVMKDRRADIVALLKDTYGGTAEATAPASSSELVRERLETTCQIRKVEEPQSAGDDIDQPEAEP